MAESPLQPELGGESSSSSTPNDKPVIVRVKRKAFQSPLETFWLEICERPLKRSVLDFQKLSISGNSSDGKEVTKRLLVQHLQTVSSFESAVRVVQSFVQPAFDDGTEVRDRVTALKKDNKHDRLLAKAKQEQEVLAKNARFEQIWRSRRGKREVIQDEALGEACRLYDVVRVDDAETCVTGYKEPEMSVEDQESLAAFLPLLREFIPSAAEEIEADIRSYVLEHGTAEMHPKGDEYVFDLYAVKEDVHERDAGHQYALVQVNDDDEFYDGLDDSDYETDDSNAENHPLNDYPEEEEEEEESDTCRSESEEHKSESCSEESSVDDYYRDSRVFLGLSKDPREDEEMYNSGYDEDEDEHNVDRNPDEDWRWANKMIP
ncbi:hypothetical protein Dimus_009020 [Dionaea muscipula]